jgi:hypothetical protein
MNTKFQPPRHQDTKRSGRAEGKSTNFSKSLRKIFLVPWWLGDNDFSPGES